MSSSVSSKHAFSQGGITISKLQNYLKQDIVEALQCIKCAIWSNLLFPAPAPSSTFKAEANEDEDAHQKNEVGEESDVDKEGWDDLLIEDEDKEHIAQIDTDLNWYLQICILHIQIWNLPCLPHQALHQATLQVNTLYNTKAPAWAKPSQSQAIHNGFGLAWQNSRPEPS